MKRILNFITVIFLLIANENFPQDGVWVETTASVLAANITPDEAKKQALDNARAEAIKQVVGIKIAEETYRSVTESQSSTQDDFFDVFSKLNRSTASGKIVEEIPEYSVSIQNETPVYTVKLNAKVIEEKGKPDYGFTAEIVMSQDVFFDRGSIKKNDIIEFKLWASKNCYLYLFNVMSNDSVQLVIPNKYINDNFYSIDRHEQEFVRKMNAIELKFRASLPEGKSLVKEALLLVALKEKIDFFSNNLSTDGQGVIPTYKAAITDIMNWLVRIPADMRTEAFKSFTIKKM